MSENAENTFNNTMDDFSSADNVQSTDAGFLNSNGIIAKIVFLIMVAIVFVMAFYAISQLIGYFSGPAKHPLFINGQINANNPIVISQNPTNPKSQLISRSNNENSGIEFTWSVWINYNSSNKLNGYSAVFVKGECGADTTSKLCSINNGPGVYFAPSSDPQSNTLVIIMDTINSNPKLELTEENASVIKVPNLPVGDYYHLAIRCRNTYIDVYINGTVVKTQNIMNAPKQNFYDLNICPCGGFNGNLSNLQYFSKSLNVVEINSIVQKGPNTTDLNKTTYGGPSSIGISTSWYNSFLR